MLPMDRDKFIEFLNGLIEEFTSAISRSILEENTPMHDTMCGSLFATARIHSNVSGLSEEKTVLDALNKSEEIVRVALDGSDDPCKTIN
jgi:hypothetical protein